MSDNEESPQVPPEVPPDATRTGQVGTSVTPILSPGLPEGSVVRELPEILLQGAREARHSELTWKLISKIAAVAEDDKATLRRELATSREETEKWRSRAEELSNRIVELRARWESVSTLSSAQAVLFVAGGLLIGPAINKALEGTLTTATTMLALLGVAAVVGAFLLGRVGPKKEA